MDRKRNEALKIANSGKSVDRLPALANCDFT